MNSRIRNIAGIVHVPNCFFDSRSKSGCIPIGIQPLFPSFYYLLGLKRKR